VRTSTKESRCRLLKVDGVVGSGGWYRAKSVEFCWSWLLNTGGKAAEIREGVTMNNVISLKGSVDVNASRRIDWPRTGCPVISKREPSSYKVDPNFRNQKRSAERTLITREKGLPLWTEKNKVLS